MIKKTYFGYSFRWASSQTYQDMIYLQSDSFTLLVHHVLLFTSRKRFSWKQSEIVRSNSTWMCWNPWSRYPTNSYLLKVNNRNARKRCEVCSNLTITPERRHWRRSGVFIVDVNHICYLLLLFLLLTLNK